MRSGKIFFIAFVCAFLLFGCKYNPAESSKTPTETLQALSEASKNKDAAAIKSYVSKGTLDLLEQSAKRQGKSVDELLKQENGAPFEKTPEIKNEQITGETATVEVKNDVTGDSEKIPFVKENGVWKVALDVFMKDAMKRLSDAMNQPPANVSPNSNADSNSKKADSNNSNK